jgi:hypothetical protein
LPGAVCGNLDLDLEIDAVQLAQVLDHQLVRGVAQRAELTATDFFGGFALVLHVEVVED